ncbi:MAG: sigma-70 family RNA polymerase sigma factor [Acutalibacteraceae bacterium]
MTARDKLINDNLGLVHSCAGKFRGKGIEYDDLFQAGCLGLIKAVNGFDETRGVRLSTYAVPVILGEIKKLFRDGGTVKVGRALKELSLKASRITAQFENEFGREPTIGEVAICLGVDNETAAQAICAGMQTLSLTADDDAGNGQIDVPVDSHEEKITDRLALQQMISALNSQDRSIIMLRFFSQLTQTETAKRLNMTQVQVSRRERKILQKLRSSG